VRYRYPGTPRARRGGDCGFLERKVTKGIGKKSTKRYKQHQCLSLKERGGAFLRNSKPTSKVLYQRFAEGGGLLKGERWVKGFENSKSIARVRRPS